MSSVEVRSYTIHTGRLGSLGVEQMIMLRHVRRGGHGGEEIAVSEVTFSDRFAASGAFGIIGDDDRVQAFLPAAAFPSWLDLLRNEDPVFLHWSSDRPGKHDPEGLVHLSTGPEPTGEGPVDLTP